jgi:DNA-binding XRE family transcriptional regulator
MSMVGYILNIRRERNLMSLRRDEMNHRDLVAIVTNVARRGLINLEAVETVEDMHTAKRFCSHFRAAVDGLDDGAVMQALSAARAKGPRKFRKGCGLWLTDKEAA